MPAINRMKIMFWNAQGISTKVKQTQLELLLEKECIDILLLAETFLKPHHSLNIRNYIVYRNDRTHQAHGGVAIVIRKNIPHKVRSPINTALIENVAIEVNINNVSTCITAAYSPKYSTHFANDIQALTSHNSQFLLFGDFNAKHTAWNCNNNNKAGISLYTTHQLSQFMIYHTPEHTHYPHSGQTPSTIDLLLSNGNVAFDLTALTSHTSSDHAPIICNFDNSVEPIQKIFYDYKNADWSKYRRHIERNINEITFPANANEIDNAIERFSKLIVDARSIAVPVFQASNKSKISVETKQLIQFRNSRKRVWQRTHTAPEKQQLKHELNRLQKQINIMVNRDVNQHWANQLRSISKGDKKLWNLAKQFRGKYDSSIDKIKVPGLSITDDSDRANQLADIFKKSHTLTSNYAHVDDVQVRNTVNNFKSMFFIESQTPSITTGEMHKIIRCLKPFKSPGKDTIQNISLKNMPPIAVTWLTNTINACIKFSYWPTAFKTAKVIPILKSGKPPSDAHSYRPISLLNAMSKILEKIIYHRLGNCIESIGLLPDFQFGFRKGHSTTHQAMRIKQFIINNKRRKWSSGVVLLDIEKAFDSIWHDGLIYKLIKLKLPTYLIRMIDAFIRNRNFSVHVNNTKSSDVVMPAGLPQGTCLSPILYSLFIADIPKCKSTELALYADDTAAYTSAKQSNVIIKRLAQALHDLEKYFIKWKIKINTNKTQAIFFPFDNKRRRAPSIPLKHGNKTIELQKTINYLGIHFDTKMSFNDHITKTIEKANKCFRALYPMLAPRSHLSTINKSLIYTAVIRPIMSYGSPIWATAPQTHKQKFKVMQNKIVKTIFKLPFRTPSNIVQKISGIPHFHNYLHVINSSFALSCRTSEFNLIREIDLL